MSNAELHNKVSSQSKMISVFSGELQLLHLELDESLVGMLLSQEGSLQKIELAPAGFPAKRL
jgi:hypothetical protein